MEEEKSTLYTFIQPVRGGYYYIVVKATSDEEATHIVIDIVSSIKHTTGMLRVLGKESEGTLILSDTMQVGLDVVGYVHRFVRTPLRPYQERVGHRGLLPK